jgi:hypothetical protein
VLPSEKKKFETLIKDLNEEEIDPKLLQTKHNFYSIELRNVGGLVTPVILKVEYTDGSTEELKLPPKSGASTPRRPPSCSSRRRS